MTEPGISKETAQELVNLYHKLATLHGLAISPDLEKCQIGVPSPGYGYMIASVTLPLTLAKLTIDTAIKLTEDRIRELGGGLP